MSKEDILSRISGPEVSDEIRRARELLSRRDTRLLHAEPSIVRVSDVKSLWKTRLDIARNITGHPILGAADLVEKCQATAGVTEIERYPFYGPTSAGVVFLVPGTAEFFGVVAVDSTGNRGTPEELMARLQKRPSLFDITALFGPRDTK